MEKKSDKKKICLEISKELYKNLQLEIVKKFGKTYGNIRIAVEEGIAMWIKEQQNSINNDDWFSKYKDLESHILEKNKEIEELITKEKQLKREIALAQ